jgi:arylsulfatase A-like enzyme
MAGLVRKKYKLLSILLLVTGSIAVALSFLADSLGVGGESGFGLKQILVLIFGIVLLLAGAVLLLPGSRRYLRDWRVPRAMLDSRGSILLVAAWFGLFTAFGELIILGEQRFIQNTLIHRGLLVIWALPLTEVTIFVGIGLILFLLSRRFPKLAKTQVVAFVFPFLGYLSIFLMFPRIHILADVVLALGLAVQTSRLAVSHPNGFYFLIYHTLGWMSVPSAIVFRKLQAAEGRQAQAETAITRRDFLVTMGVTLGSLAVGVSGIEQLVERSKLASLRTTSKKASNVLLVVLDTVRAQSLSLYGYRKPTTPQLERIAQNAIVFNNARAAAPWTLPSHASMFTGRYPHELSCGWVEPLDTTYPTLAELLSDAGYETAGFIANLDYCIREFGLNRGFVHYEDYTASFGEMIGDSALAGAIARELLPKIGDNQILGRKDAASINHDFLSWLDRRKASHPFFAFLNYYDAHDPYIPPKEFAREFMAVPSSGVVPFNKMDSVTSRETKGLNEAYDASIAYLDQQIGSLYDELARKGVLDDTFVIITSDHGEQFGEHDLYSHGNSLYRPLLYVPLMVLLPGQVSQRITLEDEVSLHEIPATVMEVLGLRTNYQFPGKSLSRFWSGVINSNSEEKPLLSEVKKGLEAPTWYPSSSGDMRALINQSVKYIMNYGTGEEELYDLKNDPGEQTNLATSHDSQKTLQWFRSSLKAMLNNTVGM